MSKLPVALQLYTVRDVAADDFFGVLKQVKDMGYDYVEFTADFFGHTAKEIRAELDKLGLRAISAHVSIDMMIGGLDKVIADFGMLGCEYIAVPWLDEARRPGTPAWPQVVEQIKGIGTAFKKAGMTLLYHNHDFEFVKIGGEYALDMLYAAVPADTLQTELDTCWVKVAGEDPAGYLLKYTGRSPVVHLKDFVMAGFGKPKRLYALIGDDGKDDAAVEAGESSFDFRPVGYGVQDFPAILDACVKAGAKYVVVEQDRSSQRPSAEAAKMSRDYLKTLGF
jgi:sugar phosphate isomerase/epimerase